MTRAVLIFGIAFAMLAAAPALAQTPKPDCKSSNLAQIALSQCAYEDFQAADKELNTIYAQFVTRETGIDKENKIDDAKAPSAVDALKKGQRAWIQYRDAWCDAVGLDAYGGTSQSMAVMQCKAAVTRNRSKELKDLLGH